MAEGAREQSGDTDEKAFPVKARPLDLNTGLLKRDHVLLQETKAGQLYIGFGHRENLLRRLSEAEFLLKTGYDPNQPRDEDGRWTSGAGATGSWSDERDATPWTSGGGATGSWSQENEAATGFAIPVAGRTTGTGRNAFRPPGWSIFSEIGPETAEALTTLGERFIEPAAFLGMLIIPIKHTIATGTLPDYPNIMYFFNRYQGRFSLYSSDHSALFNGTVDDSGLIRTKDGDVIGRKVDGSIILDANLFAGEKSDDEERVAYSGATAQANATAQDDPKLCPNPLPDVPGQKSDRAIAYEEHIATIVNPENPTPSGLAYFLIDPETGNPVSFDDCFHNSGDVVEDKGPGLAHLSDNPITRTGRDIRLLKQAYKQVSAAGNRPFIWFVEEKDMYNYLKILFARPKLDKIFLRNESLPSSYKKWELYI